MPALRTISDLTVTDRKNMRSQLRNAVREAKVANDELYSIGDMASFDMKGALEVMTDSEFVKNFKELVDFHKKVNEELSQINVVLPQNFDLKTFRKEYNKVGAVMSRASTNFNYDNPILDFIGEEA